MHHKVALIPGDSSGPEVAEQAVRILNATGVSIRKTVTRDLGGTATTREMADAIIDQLTRA
jgi:isocitrate/isopropylmalate dehydrogenase